jgi:protease-4
MTLEADSLAERRRLKRRLSFWRIGAILFAVAAVVAIFAAQGGDYGLNFGFEPYIARVSVDESLITDNREKRKMIKALSESDQVRGVIVFVNSPGGTTVGAEGLYLSLRNLAEKKPVVSVFGTAATSAAYLAGIAADHIVARGNSITGSVGVIFQSYEFTELLRNWGIKVEEIRSGPLKAVPSPFTADDGAGKALVEELVNESRDWFVDLVTQRRQISPENLVQVKTGRIYTGRQALQVGLVDELGDEATAVKWLEEKRGVPKGLKVIDKQSESGSSRFQLSALAGSLGSLVTFFVQQTAEIFAIGPQFNHLDGLISLWHPQKQQ